MSLVNATIDDGSNSTIATVIYSPPLCDGSGWAVNEKQGVGGSYRSCASSNKTVIPSASLNFTGVAIYYMSPYFLGELLSITIDGTETQNVNLSGPVGQTDNSSDSVILWSATNLNNTQHLVELKPSNGSRTLNVDAFIITQVQSDTTGTTSGNTPQVPSIPGGFASLALPTQSARTTRLSIGLGATFGALSFLIFLCIVFFLGRRSKALKQQFHFTKDIPALQRSQNYADPDEVATRGFTQSRVSYQLRTGDVLPMRNLPTSAINDYESDIRSVHGAKGWASPAHSHTNLLSSSQDDEVSEPVRPVQPRTKFEPVRNTSTLSGPRVQSGSASIHDSVPPLSRHPTFVSRLEPVRASTTSQPSSFNSAAFLGANIKENDVTVSRSTTFSSARLEPVRRGTPV